jgi:NitT/TauT family transport system permease protein
MTMKSIDDQPPLPRSNIDVIQSSSGSGGWLAPVILLTGFIVLLEGLVRLTHTPEYLVPSPTRILSDLWEKRAILMIDLETTLLEATLGFALANLFSLLIGVGFFYSRTAERAILPMLIGLKAVPIIAIAPLLVLWFGYGLGSKIIMAAIVAFFPLVVGVTTGIRSVNVESVDLMRSLSATRWEILTRLCLPVAVPHLISALKVSSTLAVVGAIVGELTGARRGLGFTILMASYNVDTPRLFSALILSALVGSILYFAVLSLERSLWRYYLGKADIS